VGFLLWAIYSSLRASTQGLRPKGGHHRLQPVPFPRSCSFALPGPHLRCRVFSPRQLRPLDPLAQLLKSAFCLAPLFRNESGPRYFPLLLTSSVFRLWKRNQSEQPLVPDVAPPVLANELQLFGSPPTPQHPRASRSQLPDRARLRETASGLEKPFRAPTRAPSIVNLPRRD